MSTGISTTQAESSSVLDKLDELVPAPLAQFDAFPKLPATYKERSESRGFMTLFVALLAFLLVLNDLGEYIWGWPDYEFSVDSDKANTMLINVDMVINMPCQFLTVDLRDAVGDRLYLSSGFRRDGTLFDIGQATALQEHAKALSVRQAVSQSRSSRGFFANIFRRSDSQFRPTYNYQPAGTACRVFGQVNVKKVTANLHITTLGHGYASATHVDHKSMNLSHVITEFSFGPYFPDITQPLDNSFELTHDPFIAYQYFLHVVPTTYVAPRSAELHTHQYSVTHYTKILEHGRGTPGIFFKFDLDPLSIAIHQRTTTFVQLLIRCVGVVGGIFVCMGYAVKVTARAVDVVSGADRTPGIVAAEASGVGIGLRKKWTGGELRSRVVRQGSGWTVEGSPYSSYAGTPVSGGFSNPGSPFVGSPLPPQITNGSAATSPHLGVPGSRAASGFGLGISSPAFGPASPMVNPNHAPTPTYPTAASPSLAAHSPASPYAYFPPTPNTANGSGFPRSPLPGGSSFIAAQQGPPRRENGLRHSSNDLGSTKKDD